MADSANKKQAIKLWGVKAHYLQSRLRFPLLPLKLQLPCGVTISIWKVGSSNYWLTGLPGLKHFEARRDTGWYYVDDGMMRSWVDPSEFAWAVLAILGDQTPWMYAQAAGCVSFWPTENSSLVKRKEATKTKQHARMTRTRWSGKKE